MKMKQTRFPALAILLAAFFISLLPNPALAGFFSIEQLPSGPPADPILRIETGMHTAKIYRTGRDANERVLLPNPALAGFEIEKPSPPADPILRIETGMHTAMIRRIGVDAKERVLVTASQDKTVRVWDLETGRLRKILRVPIDTGNDGRLDAVAISPDGKTVAAGGYDWDDSIYIFNLETGTVTRRITGLPNVISSWRLPMNQERKS